MSPGELQALRMVVCIKQVPDVPSVRMDQERMTVIREGVESIINPLDGVALETALDLRARVGGSVTAVTMGPPQSEAALREALAMGADQAVLLTDPAFAGADTLVTSHVLATAIRRLAPDLIVCGQQTIDSDTGHVGPQIAEELDLPQACGVIEIHLEPGMLTVKRVSDGFLETLSVTLPALVTVGRPARPLCDLGLGALERAFSREEILCWNLEDLGLRPEAVGFAGSATRVWKLHPPAQRQGGRLVTGSPLEAVTHLIEKLEALSIIDEEDGGQP